MDRPARRRADGRRPVAGTTVRATGRSPAAAGTSRARRKSPPCGQGARRRRGRHGGATAAGAEPAPGPAPGGDTRRSVDQQRRLRAGYGADAGAVPRHRRPAGPVPAHRRGRRGPGRPAAAHRGVTCPPRGAPSSTATARARRQRRGALRLRRPGLFKDPAATADALRRSARRAPVPAAAQAEPDTCATTASDVRFEYLARGVPVATGDAVSALKLAGIGVVRDESRVVPGHDLAANLIGFTGRDLHRPGRAGGGLRRPAARRRRQPDVSRSASRTARSTSTTRSRAATTRRPRPGRAARWS